MSGHEEWQPIPQFPGGVATAWGLAIAAGLIALVTAVGAFWSHHTVVPTPDGPAVIAVEDVQR